MANKTVDALVFCPFYVREAKTTITCEGIIEKTTVESRFKNELRKAEHERYFCMGITCKGCAVHRAIMLNYPESGTYSESTTTYRC